MVFYSVQQKFQIKPELLSVYCLTLSTAPALSSLCPLRLDVGTPGFRVQVLAFPRMFLSLPFRSVFNMHHRNVVICSGHSVVWPITEVF